MRALLLLATLLPAPALAGDAYGYLFYGGGYRRSLDAGGGLDLRFGLGAFGYRAVGLQLDSSWFADHTFADSGTEVRSTNWLVVQLRTNTDIDDGLAFSFGVGPGMGWVRPKGDGFRSPDRAPSIGAKQVARLDVVTEDDGVFLVQFVGEVMELWQDAVTPAPEIQIFVGFHLGFGFEAD